MNVKRVEEVKKLFLKVENMDKKLTDFMGKLKKCFKKH